VPGLYSETYHAVVQVINMKVGEFTDVEYEEEPVPITFPVMKTEHEVSCICMFTRGNKNWPSCICQWLVRRYSFYNNVAIYFHHDIIDCSPPHALRTN
jgi:hypothetical protein